MAEEGQMTAAEMLQQVNEAITKVLIGGQSYQIGSRMLTRADLKRVREEMEYWAGKLAEAEAEDKHGGRNRAYRAVARDV